jgi:hypothetical protein
MVVFWLVVLAVAVALGVLIGFSLWGGTEAASLDVPGTLYRLRTTIGSGGFI